MKRRFYLAYGSNLNIGQMQQRCETAKPMGKTVLENYRLVFCGGKGSAVANIERKSGASVPCALWLIGPKDEASLDRYEGVPHLYKKELVRVSLGKRTLSALVYIMRVGHPLVTPSIRYLHTIIDGYHDFELDDTALAEAICFSAHAHYSLS
jgi:hypothetical protein